MHMALRDPQDQGELSQRMGQERHAKQRDRYRAVLLAIHGLEAQEIAQRLGRSRRFVQTWAYAYRDGGIQAIGEKPRPGRPTKLPRDQEEAFKQRMLDGPTERDHGVCTLRGKDAVRILEQEFGVPYSLEGAYDLLHRLGFSCLKPRPTHRKNDPQTMRRWQEQSPLLSSACKSSTRISESKSGARMKPASASKAR